MPAAAPRPDIDRLRQALVASGRRLGARGLISAGEGNLSIRLDGESLLLTPAGRRKDELAPEHLVVVSLRRVDGTLPVQPARGLRPSSDVAIHRAIYGARPDVLGVVHAHLPAAMALTLAGLIPDPGALPETAHFIPRLPFVPFAAMGSEALAGSIADALLEGPAPLPGAALLERHGAVAVGVFPRDDLAVPADPTADRLAALDQAVDRLELVEVLCRTWRDALLLRAAGGPGDGRAILPAPSPPPSTAAGPTSRRQA